VVNVYLISDLNAENTRPKPLKTLMNINTRVHQIIFNKDSQLMAATSRVKKDCLKIVHVPTWTVYSNWPTSRTPLGHVSSIDFSPNSGMLVIGNERGKALLYRLNHYTSA
jgi:U3 small nucleolar RNA-associated protein 18